MTATMIAQQPTKTQAITPTLIALTASLVRAAHPEQASLSRALDKTDRLLTQPWRYDTASATLAITSTSQPNVIHYAQPDGCDCQASKMCWHKASALVLQTLAAAGVAPIAVLPLIDEQALDEADCYDPSDDGWFTEIDDLVVAHEDNTPSTPVCTRKGCGKPTFYTMNYGRLGWQCTDRQCQRFTAEVK